jgi:hypothetical protein
MKSIDALMAEKMMKSGQLKPPARRRMKNFAREDRAKRILFEQLLVRGRVVSGFGTYLRRCGVFRNPWTANALVTAFACGEMNIGQEVLADITRLVPDYFATMLKENNNE